jgi:nucleotide-binding universal stress UspA family protein
VRFSKILLASHGTKGARAAEEAALALCPPDGSIDHLYIVADFWLGMRGDDWLNNVAARMRFERHLENELAADMQAEFDRFAALAGEKALAVRQLTKVGKPEECLIEVAAAEAYDLVIIGAPRPKGEPGYRSRMAVEPLAKRLTRPLLRIPFPA